MLIFDACNDVGSYVTEALHGDAADLIAGLIAASVGSLLANVGRGTVNSRLTSGNVVRERGLEPLRPKTRRPKRRAAASYATPAVCGHPRPVGLRDAIMRLLICAWVPPAQTKPR